MKIKDVKKSIQSREGFPIDNQMLLYNGKKLEDDRTISDYCIPDAAHCDLVLLNGGGMAIFVVTGFGKATALC